MSFYHIVFDISFDILADINSDILSDITPDILSDIYVYIYRVEVVRWSLALAKSAPLESGAGIYRVEVRGCPLESGVAQRASANPTSRARAGTTDKV